MVLALREGDRRRRRRRACRLPQRLRPPARHAARNGSQNHPATLVPGAAFSLRLLFEGKPIAGVLIRATSERSPHAQRTARTDARGRVSFVLEQPGVWLFTGVHIIPAGSAEGWNEGVAPIRPAAEAEWESFWSSLTFETFSRR